MGFFGGIGDSLGSLFSGGSNVLGSITDLFGKLPKEVASAGIFSAASLVSQMFGRDVEGGTLDLARDRFEQDIINSEANRQLSREELASRERMASSSAGAAVAAANISANAQKEINRKRNLLESGQTRVLAQEKAAERVGQALKGVPDIVMTGRTGQAQQARATGQDGRAAFESLMRGIQAGLTR